MIKTIQIAVFFFSFSLAPYHCCYHSLLLLWKSMQIGIQLNTEHNSSIEADALTLFGFKWITNDSQSSIYWSNICDQTYERILAFNCWWQSRVTAQFLKYTDEFSSDFGPFLSPIEILLHAKWRNFSVELVEVTAVFFNQHRSDDGFKLSNAEVIQQLNQHLIHRLPPI